MLRLDHCHRGCGPRFRHKAATGQPVRAGVAQGLAMPRLERTLTAALQSPRPGISRPVLSAVFQGSGEHGQPEMSRTGRAGPGMTEPTRPLPRHRDRRVRRRLPSRSGRVRGGSRPDGLEQAREHHQRAPRGQGHQRGDGHSPGPVRRRGRRLRRTQAPGPCHPASPQTAAPITVRKFAPFRKHRKPCARLNRPGGGRVGIRLRWRPKRTIRAVERSWVFVDYGPPSTIGNRR
jgi:hypothetical protein